jgi:hypothetical protein
MIIVTFDKTDLEVQEALQKKLPAILAAVVVKMNQLNTMLVAKIVGDKLQGQVLQHRTGKLAASVRSEDSKIEGDTVTGSVQAGGGPAYYARFQNYGTQSSYEIVPRNKKALAFFPQGGPVPLNKQTARGIVLGFRSRSASARQSSYGQFSQLGGVVVKKVIHPPIKERNFMESTAAEFKPTYVAGITQAINKGARS